MPFHLCHCEGHSPEAISVAGEGYIRKVSHNNITRHIVPFGKIDACDSRIMILALFRDYSGTI